jgi:hypothetical protein
MKKFTDWYLNWYYSNPKKMRKWSIVNVILYSYLLLCLVLSEQYQWAGVVVWVWGLTIADLVANHRKNTRRNTNKKNSL